MSLDTIMTNMLLNTKKKSVFNTLMLLNSLLASLFLLNSLMTNLSVNTLMTNLSVNTCHWLHSNLSLNTWKRILSLITPMANHWPENNGVFFICWHYIVFQFISSLYQKKLVLYIFGSLEITTVDFCPVMLNNGFRRYQLSPLTVLCYRLWALSVCWLMPIINNWFSPLIPRRCWLISTEQWRDR